MEQKLIAFNALKKGTESKNNYKFEPVKNFLTNKISLFSKENTTMTLISMGFV